MDRPNSRHHGRAAARAARVGARAPRFVRLSARTLGLTLASGLAFGASGIDFGAPSAPRDPASIAEATSAGAATRDDAATEDPLVRLTALINGFYRGRGLDQAAVWRAFQEVEQRVASVAAGDREPEPRLFEYYFEAAVLLSQLPVGEDYTNDDREALLVRAREAARDLLRAPDEAQMILQLVQLRVADGRYVEAVDLLRANEAVFEQAPTHQVRQVGLLARIARIDGRFDEALELAEDGLALAGSLPEGRESSALLAEMLSVRIQTHLSLGLLDRVPADLAREKQSARESQHLVTLAGALIDELDTLLVMGRYRRALDSLEPVLNPPSSGPPRKGGPGFDARYLPGALVVKLRLRRAILRIMAEQGDVRTLREVVTELDELLTSPWIDASDAASASLWRLTALLQLGELDRVREDLAAFIEQGLPSLESKALVPAVRLMSGGTMKGAVADGGRSAAEGSGADEPSADEKAEEVFAALSRDFEALLDEWRRTPLRSGGVSYLLFTDRARVVSEYLALATERRSARFALGEWLRVQELGSEYRRAGGEPLELDALIPRLLGDGDGALVYVPGPRRGQIFVVDRDGVRALPLVGRTELEKRRAALAALWDQWPLPKRGSESAAVRGKRLEEAAAALSEILLPAALHEWLASRRSLVVVGRDLMGVIPFELLSFRRADPKSPSRTLGTALPHSYLATLPLGSLLERRSSSNRGALAFGLAPASEAARERFSSVQPWPIEASDLTNRLAEFDSGWSAILGAAATPAQLSERLGRGAPRMLWIPAHGVQLEELEATAALVLAPDGEDDDGLLRAADIGALDLRGTSLVLSACGAGRARARFGEDTLPNLAGAALGEAGAVAVVLSTADLELASQLELVESLDRVCLSEGRSLAEALVDWRRRLATSESAPDASLSSVEVHGFGHRPFGGGRPTSAAKQE